MIAAVDATDALNGYSVVSGRLDMNATTYVPGRAAYHKTVAYWFSICRQDERIWTSQS